MVNNVWKLVYIPGWKMARLKLHKSKKFKTAHSDVVDGAWQYERL